jgi:hypothetical protein
MTVYVLSTMTNSVSYNHYNYIGDPNSKAGALPVVREKIMIHGGAGIPSARSGFGDMSNDGEGLPIWTAAGMVTPVSDTKFEALKDHWLFRQHQDSGWVKVLPSDITGNHKAIKKEVASMEQRDNHSQLTPATAKERISKNIKVTVNGPKEMDSDGAFRL